MGFVALIFALLIEQGRALRPDNPVHDSIRWLSSSLRHWTDAGRAGNGTFGWVVMVGGLGLAAWLVHDLLGRLHPLALFAFHVVILYWTVGFRQFSHAFSEIQVALAGKDDEGAKLILEKWLRETQPDLILGQLSPAEVCRLTIAHALVQSHRRVFAPLFWYMLLPGPIGPVMYRVAEHLSRAWAVPVGEAYGRFAQQAYHWLDWVPLRLTLAGFCVVGNFEDAVYCWRACPSEEQRALLLATGGGAIGVRVGDAGHPPTSSAWNAADDALETAEDWQGHEADAAGLRSAVGLVWRALALWLILFALLTIATWLGAGVLPGR